MKKPRLSAKSTASQAIASSSQKTLEDDQGLEYVDPSASQHSLTSSDA